jgi:hypothetical protein
MFSHCTLVSGFRHIWEALPPQLFKDFLFSLQRIEAKTFLASGLKAVVIPASLTVLCERCFQSGRALSWVTFEPWSALERIQSLVSPTLRSKAWFSRALESVVFENGPILKQMGETSFWATRLAELTLPSSIEVVGSYCFSVCPSLELLAFETGVESAAN